MMARRWPGERGDAWREGWGEGETAGPLLFKAKLAIEGAAGVVGADS